MERTACKHKWIKRNESDNYKYFICKHCLERSKVEKKSGVRSFHANNPKPGSNLKKLVNKYCKSEVK